MVCLGHIPCWIVLVAEVGRIKRGGVPFMVVNDPPVPTPQHQSAGCLDPNNPQNVWVGTTVQRVCTYTESPTPCCLSLGRYIPSRVYVYLRQSLACAVARFLIAIGISGLNIHALLVTLCTSARSSSKLSSPNRRSLLVILFPSSRSPQGDAFLVKHAFVISTLKVCTILSARPSVCGWSRDVLRWSISTSSSISWNSFPNSVPWSVETFAGAP